MIQDIKGYYESEDYWSDHDMTAVDIETIREATKQISNVVQPKFLEMSEPTPPTPLRDAILKGLVNLGARAVMKDLKGWRPAANEDPQQLRESVRQARRAIERASVERQIRLFKILWPLPRPGPANELDRALSLLEKLSRTANHPSSKVRQMIASELYLVAEQVRDVTVKQDYSPGSGSDPDLEKMLEYMHYVVLNALMQHDRGGRWVGS